jgi:hypothetical protein
MASNINPFNIDGTFPVAGQDNTSQGFRDNFTNLRNNLGYAKSEIEDLQNKAILKTSLTGGTLSNDMGGSTLYQPALKSFYEITYNQGLISGTVTLDYANGNIQYVESDGDITLAFTGWPATPVQGRLVLWISITDPANSVTVPITNPGVTMGIADIAGYNDAGVISFDAAGDYVLEFTSLDNGQNIMIRDLSRNLNSLRHPGFYYNRTVNGAFFLGYDTSLTTAQTQIENAGVNQISALGGYNAVTVGNLQLANVQYQITDQGVLSGYTVSAARGNIVANTTFTSDNAVKSGDYLGFVEGAAFTGNGVGNAFTQVSSLNFHATGANVAYGLGGNVTVYTKTDGGTLAQALGVENDQSVKFYGNIISKPATPTGPTAVGVAGQIAVDTNYIYVCTATNTWKRVAISSAGW